MIRYYNPNTQSILSESQIRADYPNTCFSVPFSPPEGWFLLREPDVLPEFNFVRQRLVDQTPTYRDGEYFAVLSVDTFPTMVQESRIAAEVARFEAKVDADVDSIYSKTVGNRAVEYQIAYQEAKIWADTGFTGDPPFSVTAHVDAYDITPQASAEEIIAVGDQWYTLVRTLRQSRLHAKGLVRQHKFQEAEDYWNAVLRTLQSA